MVVVDFLGQRNSDLAMVFISVIPRESFPGHTDVYLTCGSVSAAGVSPLVVSLEHKAWEQLSQDTHSFFQVGEL